ncbi:DUF7343 domain-containing protein [Halobacteriaceae archaeon SHR40]|uniref:helix-turn-helix transcriptional regulator n=1 Tax=Halovenus amylolytica TaxID=2500550 RepID=UPI000FE322C1
MHRGLAVGLAVIAVVTLVTGLVLADPAGGVAQSDPAPAFAQLDEVDRTVFEITVFESGDARWRVAIKEDISSVDTERIEQFETFADRFVSEETDTFENFQLRADRLTSSGANVTGREMVATGFQRDAYYDDANQNGVVEMSFRWEEFAQVRNDRVVVSDVFDGGFGILDQQRLRIRTGENLQFATVEPDPDSLERTDNLSGSRWIRWDGPVEFATGEPNVTLMPARSELSTGQDETPVTDGESTQESTTMLPIFLALLVLVGLGGGTIWYVSNRNQPAGTTPATTSADKSTTTPVAEEMSVPEEELLSDEDRVLKLLEENGGRMRQVSIVEQTEWSKSKVSMLLSDMEDEGVISKLRVGRENIISLSGEEPDAAGSPFDDEGE